VLSTAPTLNVSLEMPKGSDLEIEKVGRVGTFDRPQVYGCCSVDQVSCHRDYRELLG